MAESDHQELGKQFRQLQEQNQQLAKEVAVLRADMKANYAETESAVDRLRADMANWKTDMANRDKSNMQWIAGLVLGSAVLVIAVLGLLLTSTPTP